MVPACETSGRDQEIARRARFGTRRGNTVGQRPREIVLRKNGFRRIDARLPAGLDHRPACAARCARKWLDHSKGILHPCQPVPYAPRCSVFSRPGTFRSRTLDAGSDGSASEILLLSLWRRKHAMHRRGFCLDAGYLDDRVPGEAVANASCPRPSSGTRTATHARFTLRPAHDTQAAKVTVG